MTTINVRKAFANIKYWWMQYNKSKDSDILACLKNAIETIKKIVTETVTYGLDEEEKQMYALIRRELPIIETSIA